MTYQHTTYEPTTAFAVANWFIDHAMESETSISYKKLQYSTYLSYGWYFAYYGIPLFADKFYVLDAGPFVDSLHAFYKGERHSKNITTKAYSAEDCDEDGNLEEEIHCIIWSDKMLTDLTDYEKSERKKAEQDIIDLLKVVWESYFALSETQLKYITCREGTPWNKIMSQIDDPLLMTISQDEIRKYFSALLKKYDRVAN